MEPARRSPPKVSLVYNPAAGDGMSSEELSRSLEKEGLHVVHVTERDPDLQQAAREHADMVLVAGGDGTVARAALAMRGQRLPLAILPMGTANNIAATLDLLKPLHTLANKWKHPHVLKLDVGTACVAGTTYNFLEGVGAGLIPAGIAAMDNDPNASDEEPEERIERAIRTYRTLLANMSARPAVVTIDGERIGKRLLMLEVLNIRSVGASVVMSLEAKPSDGNFTVVLGGEEDRDEIDAYLRRRINGIAGHLNLPTYTARNVRIEGFEQLHIDDVVVAAPHGEPVDLHIEPAVVKVLV